MHAEYPGDHPDEALPLLEQYLDLVESQGRTSLAAEKFRAHHASNAPLQELIRDVDSLEASRSRKQRVRRLATLLNVLAFVTVGFLVSFLVVWLVPGPDPDARFAQMRAERDQARAERDQARAAARQEAVAARAAETRARELTLEAKQARTEQTRAVEQANAATEKGMQTAQAAQKEVAQSTAALQKATADLQAKSKEIKTLAANLKTSELAGAKSAAELEDLHAKHKDLETRCKSILEERDRVRAEIAPTKAALTAATNELKNYHVGLNQADTLAELESRSKNPQEYAKALLPLAEGAVRSSETWVGEPVAMSQGILIQRMGCFRLLHARKMPMSEVDRARLNADLKTWIADLDKAQQLLLLEKLDKQDLERAREAARKVLGALAYRIQHHSNKP